MGDIVLINRTCRQFSFPCLHSPPNRPIIRPSPAKRRRAWRSVGGTSCVCLNSRIVRQFVESGDAEALDLSEWGFRRRGPCGVLLRQSIEAGQDPFITRSDVATQVALISVCMHTSQLISCVFTLMSTE